MENEQIHALNHEMKSTHSLGKGECDVLKSFFIFIKCLDCSVSIMDTHVVNHVNHRQFQTNKENMKIFLCSYQQNYILRSIIRLIVLPFGDTCEHRYCRTICDGFKF